MIQILFYIIAFLVVYCRVYGEQIVLYEVLLPPCSNGYAPHLIRGDVFNCDNGDRDCPQQHTCEMIRHYTACCPIKKLILFNGTKTEATITDSKAIWINVTTTMRPKAWSLSSTILVENPGGFGSPWWSILTTSNYSKLLPKSTTATQSSITLTPLSTPPSTTITFNSSTTTTSKLSTSPLKSTNTIPTIPKSTFTTSTSSASGHARFITDPVFESTTSRSTTNRTKSLKTIFTSNNSQTQDMIVQFTQTSDSPISLTFTSTATAITQSTIPKHSTTKTTTGRISPTVKVTGPILDWDTVLNNLEKSKENKNSSDPHSIRRQQPKKLRSCEKLPYVTDCSGGHKAQFTLRWYVKNGMCCSYPWGHCKGQFVMEEPAIRTKMECEFVCLNKSTPDKNHTLTSNHFLTAFSDRDEKFTTTSATKAGTINSIGSIVRSTPRNYSCDWQPFKQKCDNGRRSQFTLRWFKKDSMCCSYPWGHCRGDLVIEENTIRTKNGCEEICLGKVSNVGEGRDGHAVRRIRQHRDIETMREKWNLAEPVIDYRLNQRFWTIRPTFHTRSLIYRKLRDTLIDKYSSELEKKYHIPNFFGKTKS